MFCLLGLEFNLSIIAAILTIVGYSLNDTVVVFDRIREFLRKYKSMPLADLIDFSINSVLPRTLMTSITTLIALLALYIFGGEVISGFTFAMIWGILVGTYSSFFIAAPVLILLGTVRDEKKAEAKTAAKATPEALTAHYPGRPPSTAYGNGGFGFAGMSHWGSILVLPSGMYRWDVIDLGPCSPRFCAVIAEQAGRSISCFWAWDRRWRGRQSQCARLFAEAA